MAFVKLAPSPETQFKTNAHFHTRDIVDAINEANPGEHPMARTADMQGLLASVNVMVATVIGQDSQGNYGLIDQERAGDLMDALEDLLAKVADAARRHEGKGQ